MDGYTATRTVVRVLEESRIPYLIVGSISSSAYAMPRSTQDADFVVTLQKNSLDTLMAGLGPGFLLDPQASFETVTGTLRHIIEVTPILFKIELFLLSDDEHDQARFERRKRVHLDQIGCAACLPTPEDVIITKLRWVAGAKRNKDWDDVRDVIAVQGDEALDWNYIHHWCEKHGTRQTLDDIRASIPPIE